MGLTFIFRNWTRRDMPNTMSLQHDSPSASRWVCLAVGLLTFMGGSGQGSGAPLGATGPMTPASGCQGLAGLSVAATDIGEPTSGATVRSVELIAADAPGNLHGEYCKVLGAIHPVDRGAPDINFEVNLPSSWNHKMLQFGGGGLNGVLVTGLGFYSRQPETEAPPLKRGYVTLGSDSGHQSGIAFDGRFYLNAEALENYGHQQIKKTHDVALQLIRARYGSRPSHSYFIGSSQGGHEGFDAAQRYPDDYDGVVAGYPAHNVLMLHLSAWHYAKALQASDGRSWINPRARSGAWPQKSTSHRLCA